MLSVERATQALPAIELPSKPPCYAWPGPIRRIRGTMLKLLYRWTHSRAFRHNERLWGAVAVERHESGYLQRMRIGRHELPIENADTLLGAFNGACHLIATGPSINDIDYASLDLDHVMGVNGAIALQDRHPVQFDYYCIVDAGFARNRPDLVARVMQQRLVLFATPLVLWYIAQYFPLEQMQCRVFPIEDVRYPACRRALRRQELHAAQTRDGLVMFDEARALGFSLDIRRGTFDGRTVAYTGLQILHSLGFDTLYLHGLDFRHAARTPRFYETANTMQPSSLDDHFDAFIAPSFREAAALLERRGVRMVNLSPHSALDAQVAAKGDWRQLRRASLAYG